MCKTDNQVSWKHTEKKCQNRVFNDMLCVYPEQVFLFICSFSFSVFSLISDKKIKRFLIIKRFPLGPIATSRRIQEASYLRGGGSNPYISIKRIEFCFDSLWIADTMTWGLKMSQHLFSWTVLHYVRKNAFVT